MKRITFITTGQPSTNPRLVREVDTLIKFGYNVKVIYCFYQEWASKYDLEFFKQHPKTYYLCGGYPHHNSFIYLISRIRHKLANFFTKWKLNFGLAERAISRTHLDALKMAKSIQTDLYIAHNLGALPAAVLAAKHQNCKVGYDAEDMHSAQFNDYKSIGYVLNKYIEERYFRKTDYFTAASPLIAHNYKLAYPYLNPVVLNNVFPNGKFIVKTEKEGTKTIKLFWFSQTIGRDRGLEEIIVAMLKFEKEMFELHLLGNISATDKDYFLHELNAKVLSIFFYEPIAPSAIIAFASQFDIGLALEPAFCLNNDIALSNKIFTYLQSGLAIVMSETSSQRKFSQENPNIGKSYPIGNIASLVEIIKTYDRDRELLYMTKQNALQLAATTYNWEVESEKFISIVEKTLEN